MERNRLWMAGAAALGLTFGCEVSAGSPIEDGGLPDGTVGDAGMMTDAATPDGGGPTCEPSRLLFTATENYVQVDLILFDPAAPDEPASGISLADESDAIVGRLGCEPIVLRREREGESGGTIQVQSSEDPLTTLRALDLKPTPATYVNPQAVVRIRPEKAYVVPRELNVIQIVNPTRQGTAAVIGSVDLSGFVQDDDADGLVEPTDAIRIGDRVYVALSNQYFNQAFQVQFTRSILAVIDVNTDALVDMDSETAGVQGIALQGNNPSRGLLHDSVGNRLLLGMGGAYAALDGGLEAIDLATGLSQGYLLRESDVGELGGMIAVSDRRAYLWLSPEYGANPVPGALRSLDLSTFEFGDRFFQGAGGAVLLGDHLYAWSGTTLARFIAATGQEDTNGYPVEIGDKALQSGVAVP